jgi:hypothetical protein
MSFDSFFKLKTESESYLSYLLDAPSTFLICVLLYSAISEKHEICPDTLTFGPKVAKFH